MTNCFCGRPLIRRVDESERTTLVGYASPPGHSHDDNCRKRVYACEAGHETELSVINRCPACDWTGKKTCFCSVKVDRWPDAGKS